ncbi:MAG: diguanylate cyclase [Alphaproteobacteria bacterium]|nr:diguanylate cyclase [Alphaproteobacteria bacterium]
MTGPAVHSTMIPGVCAAAAVLLAFSTLILSVWAVRARRKIIRLKTDLIAKSKELEEVRKQKEGLHPFISAEAESIILSMDARGKIAQINDHGLKLFGYARRELVGKSAFGTIFAAASKENPKLPLVARIIANPRLYLEYEAENIKKNGDKCWISWTNRVIYDDKGAPSAVHAVGFDITGRKKLEEELRYLASVDPLTGMLNRQAFLETAARELKRAIRYSRQLSLMVARFSHYQNVSAPAQGFSDDMLRQIVNICRASIRESDIIGRIGDVEFAIVLPETPLENSMFVSDRLKEKIQEYNLRSTNGSFIEATFGVTGKETPDDTIDDLLLDAQHAADAAGKLKKTDKASKKRG